MKKRIAVPLVAMAAALALAGPAQAALRQVHVGNFYFEDATVGDGKVEATVGDQLQFVIDDGGSGTPHTVEVDELNIHSGMLSTGQTFTTPPIPQAGTYLLYCKTHLNRGHKTTLIVDPAAGTGTTTTTTTAPSTTTTTAKLTSTTTSTTTATTTKAGTGSSSSTTTTTRPTTGTVAPSTSTTSSSGTTAASGSAGSASTTGGASSSGTVEAPSPGSDLPGPSAGGTGSAPQGETTDTTLASVGVGKADASLLAGAPGQPGSLDTLLGRKLRGKAPWTRSIRLSLVALIPMAGAAGASRFRVIRRDVGPHR